MSSLIEKNRTANETLFRNTRTLVLGRLVAIFLILGIGALWFSDVAPSSATPFSGGPIAVFVASMGATAVYLALLYLGWSLVWQVRLQLLVDAVLITWLVAITGGLSSPFVTLYIVLIAVSSVFLRPGATLAIAAVSVVLLAVVGLLPALGLAPGSGQDIKRVLQIISFHIVAFMVVGLLSARLSDRRSSGEELKAAARTLANLRALHERIVESIRSGLIITDLDGTIYSANASAAEITGLAADELKGRSIFSLFPDMAATLDLIGGPGERDDLVHRFDTDFVTPDGFAVHIGYSISYLYSETNEASGLIVTCQDLTEIRSMEENIRRKDRLAAVGRIGAGLAHEIRNPLGAMRGAIQVLESATPPDSMQADLMGIIMRESDRLNRIITSFLDYARPKAGDFTETDVCQAIRETARLIRHSPELGSGHEIVEELPDGPVVISADVSQLKQIFWNLARNAISAMPEGGRLSIGLSSIPNNRIRIVFGDTGVGMPPERVEQLFEPFSQSTTGGTGLGLSIVYQIVRDHNGTINVRSTEGEGTVITIELPVENTRRGDRTAAGSEHSAQSPLENFLNVRADRTEVSS